MEILICRKSLSDLKHPIVKTAYTTSASTVGELICEMVTKNYARRPVQDSLASCLALAATEFEDRGYYIVNATKDIKYSSLSQDLQLSEGDELVLIKLKYVRGLVW